MTFDQFKYRAIQLAIYPNVGKNLPYAVLGLVGEAGEVANKVKKVLRDDAGVMTVERRDAIKAELGDVLWYCAAVAHEIEASLDNVAETSLSKLEKRVQTGTVMGDGDNR